MSTERRPQHSSCNSTLEEREAEGVLGIEAATLMPSPQAFADTRLIHSSFSKHRFKQDVFLPPLKTNLSTQTLLPAWASLPTPPMSGTPPQGPLLDPPQIAGRRRKRDDPPPTITPGTSTTATTSDVTSPLTRQVPFQYGESSRIGRGPDRPVMPTPMQMPWDQPSTFGSGESIPAFAQFGPPTTSLRQPPQVSPRSTRKTKAHVASACVNCKKKHLRCDESRPCQRCRQQGKEDTCVDVTHKKRGRPPLKPDDGQGSRLMNARMLPPLSTGAPRAPLGPPLPPLLPTPTQTTGLSFPSYGHPTTHTDVLSSASGQFTNHPRPSFPTIPQQVPSTSYPYNTNLAGFPHYPQYPTQNPHQYPASMYPRHARAQSQMAPGGYSTSYLSLPPILPAPTRTDLDSAYAQFSTRSAQPTQSQNLRPQSYSAAGTYSHGLAEETEGPDPKRPRMDIQGILHPRD